MEGEFRVGEWLVQPQIGTITRGDETVQLEPKVMEVLVYIARHPDGVLPKERIIQAVWGDTFVTDEVLTNAISELRRAFGDDAKDPRFIQTLPRRGYRLIAEVSTSDENQPEEPVPASSQLWQQSVLALLAAALLLVVVFIPWWSWPASPDEPIDSIAVVSSIYRLGDLPRPLLVIIIGAIKRRAKLSPPGGVAELAQCFGFNLADTLPRQ